ncbi:MAG: NAD(P)-dependent oxidoreductase [Bryobacterales bacterium]|nr:NAD(P)-dependent oxidoreductase [Bryobacterales bacterium]
MKIFITGIQGFLGSAMAAAFRRRGWRVGGSARAPRDRSIPRLTLGDEPPAGLFAGFDVVIHGAYDPHAGLERNVTGTRRIYRAAVRDRVPRQVLISSYSARPAAPTTYGQIKHTLEQFFLAEAQTIVRPGMVTGGGMFERVAQMILRSPLVPLIGSGADLVPILDVDDFTLAMERILEKDERGAFNLFAPRLPASRRVAQLVCQATGHRALLVPVPAWVVIAGARLAFWLRLTRFDASSGARMARINRLPAYESDLVRLIGAATEPEDAIRRSVAVGR